MLWINVSDFKLKLYASKVAIKILRKALSTFFFFQFSIVLHRPAMY